HDFFQDGAQAASTAFTLDGFVRNGAQRPLGEAQLHAIHLEELLELLDQAVLRRRQDVDERFLAEFFERGEHGQATDEFGDEAELEQVLGLNLGEQIAELQLFLALHVGAKAEARLPQAPLDDLVEAYERATHDEEDVAGIDLQEVLLRMLATTLGRHVGHRPLDDLQERLLHAFTRNVAGDGRVVALATHLVDFVDVDDSALGALDVVIG